MKADRHDHPVFARLYNWLTWAGELTTVGRWRTEALQSAKGRLLIVGLGPGHDLAHLPPAVTEVVAVEPAAAMRRISSRRKKSMPVQLIAGVGEHLPLPDASVDSVLLALVLCTVEDPVAVLLEVARVLRPGGSVCVLEHVRARDGSVLGRVQDRLAHGWARIAGGCEPHRRTQLAFEAAGYDTSGLQDRTCVINVPLLAPHLIGVARPPAAG
ncbi:MAG TPA: class I SAM-dependent methyltransferase [Frankiaceae bacterium]|nr:class I SAM-dependent methyltransferase [Frankiaceae bacterium]